MYETSLVVKPDSFFLFKKETSAFSRGRPFHKLQMKKSYFLLAIISLYKPINFANMIFSSFDAPSASFPTSRTIS